MSATSPSHRLALGLVAVSATALVAGSLPSVAAASAAQRGTTVTRTAYAMSAAGFGTRVRGGDVPVSSGTSSYDAIGCTNKAGVAHGEHVESVDLAGLGTATGVDTQVSTVRSGKTTRVVSTHSIAAITVADTVAGTVSIQGITSTARAWHDADGFHSDAGTTIASVTLTPVAGPSVALDVPTVGHPLVVPGLLTLSTGDPKLGGGSRGAWARTTGLLLTVPDSDTRVEVARARATISGGVTIGLFRGSSYAVDADALGGTATVGRHPLSLMPCQGTDGKARRKAMTTVDLGALVVDTLTSRQVADQEPGRAWGRESATVARVDVGDGALVIRDIVAQAHAVRTRSGVRTDARGTGLGDIRVDGHRVRLPASGRLRVPGVAKIETKLVTRGKDKISVVGLRLTLLDGSGAVVDLARANVQVLPSGR